MQAWTFVVPIAPRGAARNHPVVIAGHASTYPDAQTVAWQQQIAFAAASVLPTTRLVGPIGVSGLALLPRPKRMLQRSKKTGQLLHAAESLMWAPVKPDRDNIDKGVLDGLKPFWQDDAQVVNGGIAKCYCEVTGRPRVIVRVTMLDDQVPGCLLDVARLWP